ncbi:hypothetical protein [Methanococcoides vulcani]|nr:hypothetical protein [Methanococcoides vulcani]
MRDINCLIAPNDQNFQYQKVGIDMSSDDGIDWFGISHLKLTKATK